MKMDFTSIPLHYIAWKIIHSCVLLQFYESNFMSFFKVKIGVLKNK